MDPDVQREIRKFLREHVERARPLAKRRALARWALSTTGEEDSRREGAELEEKWRQTYQDRHDFRLIGEWLREAEGIDPLVRRQLEVLQLRFLEHQTDLVSIRESVDLEAQLEVTFARHRGTIRGEPVTANEISEILREAQDPELRREAWEAGKSIGAVVRRDILRLIHLRNRSAQRLGFRDHYEMALKLQEMDEKILLDLLDDLEIRTNEVFRRVKERIDARLADRFGISPWDLRPWHYADPWFREPPPDPELDLDAVFQGVDMTLLAERTFRLCGLSVEDIVKTSDLEAREGKSQHAFTLCVDREAKDIRILANLVGGERAITALLHELGHAVYDKYQDIENPWLLMEPAHPASTEAVAVLFGRMTQDPRWLKRVARADAATVDENAPRLAARGRLALLLRLRFALVMVRFERQLYRDPEQDLDRLWWQLVQRIQRVAPPELRRSPDWAAEVHFSLAPVYFHNHLLGQLQASQLEHHIRHRLPGAERVVKAETGDFLVNGIFRVGRTKLWEEMLLEASGEGLNPSHLLTDLQELRKDFPEVEPAPGEEPTVPLDPPVPPTPPVEEPPGEPPGEQG
jgi:hypothetical protein